METFRRCVTYLRNWLLAVLGSPTMHTLTSPLSEVPSMVVLGTPPNSISRMPRFTSSFPAQSNSPFSQKQKRPALYKALLAGESVQRQLEHWPWMVGKRLVHRLWYRFLSWLISNTFSHSFSVIWLLMLSAVCSSSRSSLPPNYNHRTHTFNWKALYLCTRVQTCRIPAS